MKEAAIECPETIGEYTKDLPLNIEAEYHAFLEEMWKEFAPEELKGTPLVLEEQKLRELMTTMTVKESRRLLRMLLNVLCGSESPRLTKKM